MPFPNTNLSFNRRTPVTGKEAGHFPSQNLSKGALQLRKKQENHCLPLETGRKICLDGETGNYTNQIFPQ